MFNTSRSLILITLIATGVGCVTATDIPSKRSLIESFIQKQRYNFNWKAKGDLKLNIVENAKKVTIRASVELLYKHPSQFRMDFLGPFGLTEASLVIKNKTAVFVSPKKEKVYIGTLQELPFSSSLSYPLAWIEFARLFVGVIHIENVQMDKILTTKNGYKIKFRPGIWEWQVIKKKDRFMEHGIFTPIQGKPAFNVSYDHFSRLDDIYFAKSVNIEFVNRGPSIQLNFKEIGMLKNITVNYFDVPIDSNFKIYSISNLELSSL